jgi:acyl-CoA thioesterase
MDDLECARRCAQTMYARDKASQALSIEIDIPAAGSAEARMRVRDDMLNGFDICHGGLVFTVADTAFAFACNAYNRLAVAGSASIEFLRPAGLNDELRALAREEHRRSRGGFYTVEVHNQNNELIALFRGRSVSRDEALFDEAKTFDETKTDT